MHPLTSRPASIWNKWSSFSGKYIVCVSLQGTEGRHACRSLHLLQAEILSLVNGMVLAWVISCRLSGACVCFLRPGDAFPYDCAEPGTFLVFAESFCFELELHFLPHIPGCLLQAVSLGGIACKYGECVYMRSAISGWNKAFSDSRSSVTVLVQNFTQDNGYCNSAEVVIRTWDLGISRSWNIMPSKNCF